MSDSTDDTVVSTPTDEAIVSPVPDSDTPAFDSTKEDTGVDPSPFDSDAGATSTDSETTASDGTDESGSEPSPVDETESSSPTLDESSSSPADGDTGASLDTPDPDEQPESDLLTGGTYDGTPGNTAGGPDVNVSPGKDGTSPDTNQGVFDGSGPGVETNVSLSPTDEGVPEALSNDDEPDTEPVITQPDEQTTAAGLEPTFVTQAVVVAGPTGHTPRFTAQKVGDVVSVRKVGWVGADTFDLHLDDIDELAGLLTALRDA